MDGVSGSDTVKISLSVEKQQQQPAVGLVPPRSVLERGTQLLVASRADIRQEESLEAVGGADVDQLIRESNINTQLSLELKQAVRSSEKKIKISASKQTVADFYSLWFRHIGSTAKA